MNEHRLGSCEGLARLKQPFKAERVYADIGSCKIKEITRNARREIAAVNKAEAVCTALSFCRVL